VPEAGIVNVLAYPFCHASGRFRTQVKGFAAYTIPRIDLLVSAALQSVSGPALSANYVAANALVQPSLGRPLSGNAANVTVNLIEPRSFYGERMNQLDLRFGKLLRYAGTRVQLNVDLYNVLNQAAVLTESNAYSSFRTPTAVLPPRLFKIGVQYDF
jgi:hypothetical protein